MIIKTCSYQEILLELGNNSVAWKMFAHVDEKDEVDGRTQLVYAARYGDLEESQHLLDEGADVNLADNSNCTPLRWSSEMDHLKLTEFLLEKGADPNIADDSGITPLWMATELGLLKVCKLLIESGADVNKANLKRTNPLMRAVKWGRLELCKLLVDNGAEVNSSDVDGNSPLRIASELEHFRIVTYLLEHGADVNIKGSDGQPIVNSLLDSDLPRVASLLIRSNSNGICHSEIKMKASFETILWSVENNDMKILNHVLKTQDCDEITKDQMTSALGVAAENSHYQVCKLLLDNNVNYSKCVDLLLICASQHGDLALCEIMIAAGADPSALNHKTGFSAILAATKFKKFEICKFLLKTGKKLSFQGKINALYYACKNGQLKLVGDFLKAGANVNSYGCLHVALEFYYLEIVFLLVKKGADTNQVHNIKHFEI